MKTVLSTMLPVVLTLGLFGCDQKSESNEVSQTETATETAAQTQSQNEAQMPASTLPDDAPVVIVGTDANYPPYEFKDDKGNATGFDIDLIRAIGEKEGFKVEVLDSPWDTLFEDLESGKRDLIAAGTTHSAERESKYLLSSVYAPLPNTIAYLDDNIKIDNIEDIKGLNISVLDGSSPDRYFSSHNYGLANLERYPTTYLAIQALIQGKVDAIASDSGVIQYTFHNMDLDGSQPKYFDYEKLDESGARKVMIARKDNAELLKKVNAGLQAVKEDGTYAKLTEKWFGKNLTPDLEKQQKMLSGN